MHASHVRRTSIARAVCSPTARRWTPAFSESTGLDCEFTGKASYFPESSLQGQIITAARGTSCPLSLLPPSSQEAYVWSHSMPPGLKFREVWIGHLRPGESCSSSFSFPPHLPLPVTGKLRSVFAFHAHSHS